MSDGRSVVIVSVPPVHHPEPARHYPHDVQREIGRVCHQRQELRGVDLYQLGAGASDDRSAAARPFQRGRTDEPRTQ